MASTHKTQLGLNQWLSTDRPKWADFNKDNQLVDALLQKRATLDSGGHVAEPAANALALGGKKHTELFDEQGRALKAVSSDKLGGVAASGYARAGHSHTAGDIVSGILPPSKGGTGAASLAAVTVGNASKLGGVAASLYACVEERRPTLLNGWTQASEGGCLLVKTGKIVTMTVSLTNATSSDAVPFILPEGWRPEGSLPLYDGGTNVGWIRYWSGELMLRDPKREIELCMTFVAAQ